MTLSQKFFQLSQIKEIKGGGCIPYLKVDGLTSYDMEHTSASHIVRLVRRLNVNPVL